MGSLNLLSTSQATEALEAICLETGGGGFALPPDSSLCQGDWCFRLGSLDVRLCDDLSLVHELDAREPMSRALSRAEGRLGELGLLWGLRERTLIGTRVRPSGLAAQDG